MINVLLLFASLKRNLRCCWRKVDLFFIVIHGLANLDNIFECDFVWGIKKYLVQEELPF